MRIGLQSTSDAVPELALNTSCRNIKLYKTGKKSFWSSIPLRGFKKSPLNEKDAMYHQYLGMDML